MLISSDLGELKEVELAPGIIRYRELGTGEPIVFVHGLLVNGDSNSASARSEFLDGAMSLDDCRVDVCSSSRVGVRHRNPPEARPADHVREFVLRSHGVEQTVVVVGVAVRPAVDRNGLDVSRRIEAAAREHPAELSTNLPLDVREWAAKNMLGEFFLSEALRRLR